MIITKNSIQKICTITNYNLHLCHNHKETIFNPFNTKSKNMKGLEKGNKKTIADNNMTLHLVSNDTLGINVVFTDNNTGILYRVNVFNISEDMKTKKIEPHEPIADLHKLVNYSDHTFSSKYGQLEL